MRTPSIGIDQNEENYFIDRYIGRMPKFLHMIPEAGICDVNPDYIRLIMAFINGDIDKNNISDELYKEVSDFIDVYNDPDAECGMSDEDKALTVIIAYFNNPANAPWANPPEACKEPDFWLNCDDLICCSKIVSCVDREIP